MRHDEAHQQELEHQEQATGLAKIQGELVAPKGQFNSFGKYKYRSCEDILTALKPHLLEHNYHMVISDSIEQVGDRVYVAAQVVLFDKDGKVVASNKSYAREPETKKGMDESQITGTASSYARKYALNGLFAIDDTKDADTDEHTKAVESAKPRRPHDEHMKTVVKSLEECDSLDRLRIIARDAANYFKEWGQDDLAKQVIAEGREQSERFKVAA